MTIVCIAGMYHSGNRMVAKLLNICGLEIQGGDVAFPFEFGDFEYKENYGVVEINDSIFEKLDGTWQKPFDYDVLLRELNNADSLNQQIQQAQSLVSKLNNVPFWGWSDPRNSLTFPFWQRLIPDLKIIICLRNPLDVAQSIRRGGHLSEREGIGLWHIYNQYLFSNLVPGNCLITHYDAYFFDPELELKRLLDFIEVSPDHVRFIEACTTTKPLKQGNRSTVERLIESGVGFELIYQYVQMCSQAGPVFWKMLETNAEDKDSSAIISDYELVTRIKRKDSIVIALASRVAKKAQDIENLSLQVAEIGRQFAEVDSAYQEILLSIPWKIGLFLRKGYAKLFPPNSVHAKALYLSYRAIQIWTEEGQFELFRKINRYFKNSASYQKWIRNNEQDLALLEAGLKETNSGRALPLISIVMPVYNPRPKFLNEAIISVRKQVYENWELCIADDASTNPAVRDLIESHAREDARIRFVFRENNGHISAASNSALELVIGDFFALLDHDDVLHLAALYYIAKEINKYPDVEVIYSDEDKLNKKGQRCKPYFKPDFDYDLLLSHNMISHLGVYKTATVRSLGGFRVGLEGSQDYDLVLRVLENIKPSQIRHIPRVLYHWRISEQSVAAGAEAKPYAYEAARRAIKEHLDRQGMTSSVEFVPNLFAYQVRYSIPDPKPSVDIIIISHRMPDKLIQVVDSILSKTTYPNYRILLCTTTSSESILQLLHDNQQKYNIVTVIQINSSERRESVLNHLVSTSTADYICFLDDKVIRVSPEWLERLVSNAINPGVGAVSPAILDPNNKIYKSGIILGGNELVNNLFQGLHKRSTHEFGWSNLQRGYSVLPGECLMVKRENYLEVDGLEENHIKEHYHNVDFCLKLKEKGFRNILITSAEIQLCKNGNLDKRDGLLNAPKYLVSDQNYIKSRWENWVEYDSAFNPNLLISNGELFLAENTRVKDI